MKRLFRLLAILVTVTAVGPAFADDLLVDSGECTTQPSPGSLSEYSAEHSACESSDRCQIINLATTANCGMGEMLRVFKKPTNGTSYLAALIIYCTSSCGTNGFKAEQQPMPSFLRCTKITDHNGNDTTDRTYGACVKECDDCQNTVGFVTANATYHTMKKITDASCDRYTGTCTKTTKFACAANYYGTPDAANSSACTQCPKIYDTQSSSTVGNNYSMGKCCLENNFLGSDAGGNFRVTDCCAK